MFPSIRRPPWSSSFRRSKKFFLPLGVIVALFLVVTFQYRPPFHQVIIYRDSARDFFVPGNILVPYDVKRISTQSNSLGNGTAKDQYRGISAQPKLQKMINATKTLYPVTINAPYLIENPELCSSVKKLSVLVIVHTAPSHFKRRLAIRQTWTNDSYYQALGSIRVLFLLGRVKDPKLQLEIEHEFKQHKDLLQGDFIDAYRNLTHKGVMGYKWIAERCRNAQFILKVDDDITVNMYKLFTEVLPKYKGKSKEILCNHIHPGTMLIIREKKSKWYVNENHFRGQKFYPRYCSGFMVLFTNDAIPAIYRSASLTPFFWVDDVYLYGLVPSHVPGIHYNGLKKGSHQLSGNIAVKCYRNTSKTCDFLVTGAGEPAVMAEIWRNMGQLYQKAKNTVIKLESTPSTPPATSPSDKTTRKPAVKKLIASLPSNGGAKMPSHSKG